MNTQTAEKTKTTTAEPATSKGEVATTGQDEGKQALARRGISMEQWRVLQEAIFPSAKSKQSILLALDYCKARNLDPFKRPVHIVPIWDREANNGKGGWVETIWPGISELRTTAARTGAYAGKTPPKFGPDIEMQLGTEKLTFPEWCEITVFRVVNGTRVPFTGIVYWLEAYQTKKDGKTPNAMWKRRIRGQLAKCAEAEALREAFPEELGAEEIDAEATRMSVVADGVYGDAAETDADHRPERKDFTDIEGKAEEVSEQQPEKPLEEKPDQQPKDQPKEKSSEKASDQAKPATDDPRGWADGVLDALVVLQEDKDWEGVKRLVERERPVLDSLEAMQEHELVDQVNAAFNDAMAAATEAAHS